MQDETDSTLPCTESWFDVEVDVRVDTGVDKGGVGADKTESYLNFGGAVAAITHATCNGVNEQSHRHCEDPTRKKYEEGIAGGNVRQG